MDGPAKVLREIIASTFASQYIHTDLNHEDFLRIAEEDSGLKEVYRDNQAVVFEVIALPLGHSQLKVSSGLR